MESTVGRGRTAKRVFAVLALIALAGTVLLHWTWFWGGPQPYYFFDTDFYRKAVVAVQHGVPMYEAMAYPPFAYLLIWWLPALPMLVGDQLWTAASFLVLIAVGFLLTARALDARGKNWRDDREGLAIWGSVNSILLIISMPMFSQFTCGQLSLFVAALAFVDVCGVVPKRFQGILVGLAAAIKVTPMIFAVYYLVTGQRRQALNSVGSFAVFTAFGALFFPTDTLAFWTRLTSTGEEVDPLLNFNLGIRSVLARISLDLSQRGWLWGGLGLALLVVTLWRSRKLYQRNQAMEAALVVGSAAIVVVPNVLPHYFLWLPMAAIWLVMTGGRLAKVLGVLIYVVYSPLYYFVVLPFLNSADFVNSGDPMWKNALAVFTIVPMLLGVFGLPKRPAYADAESPIVPDVVPV